MTMTQSNGWNPKKLAQFGHILSVGYDPGLEDNTFADKTWSTQAQCRAAQMLGRGYNPGL